MLASQSLREYFSQERINIIIANAKRYFDERGRQPYQNEEFTVEYGYSDAEVTVRYWNGYLIFVNTIGCG